MKNVQELLEMAVETIKASGIDLVVSECKFADGSSSNITLANNSLKFTKYEKYNSDFEGYALAVDVVNRSNGTDENKSIALAIEKLNGCCGHIEYRTKIYNRFSANKCLKIINEAVEKYKELTAQK